MSQHIWWYAARSGGIVAWALLAGSVILGLLLSARLRPGGVKPAWTLDLHRFLGGLAVTFTGIHVVSILLDSYTSIGPSDVLVPFTSSWRPAAVGWGVVALYLALAVEVTSLVRRKIPQRWWKRIHLGSYALYGMATAHFVTAGTDTSNRVVAFVVGATSATIVGLTAWRALAPRPQRAPRPRRVDGTARPAVVRAAS